MGKLSTCWSGGSRETASWSCHSCFGGVFRGVAAFESSMFLKVSQQSHCTELAFIGALCRVMFIHTSQGKAIQHVATKYISQQQTKQCLLGTTTYTI